MTRRAHFASFSVVSGGWSFNWDHDRDEGGPDIRAECIAGAELGRVEHIETSIEYSPGQITRVIEKLAPKYGIELDWIERDCDAGGG